MNSIQKQERWKNNEKKELEKKNFIKKDVFTQ